MRRITCVLAATTLVLLAPVPGQSTIVLFGRDPAQVASAANSLRGVHNSTTTALELPGPTQAVLEGRACS